MIQNCRVLFSTWEARLKKPGGPKLSDMCVANSYGQLLLYDVWVIVLPAQLLRLLSHLGTIAMNRCARFRISRLTMNIEYPWHDLCSSFLVPCCTFLTVHSVHTLHNMYVKYVTVTGTDKCMNWVKRKINIPHFECCEKILISSQ